MYKIAKDYYNQGNYRQALHEFKKILLIESTHKEAREYIERILITKKQRETMLRERAIAEAIKEAEEILRIEEGAVPGEISFDTMTEIPPERRKAIIDLVSIKRCL